MANPSIEEHSDTWELINGELTSRLARQDQSSSRIETKATLVVGFAATATQFLATQHPSNAVLASFAFASYAASFVVGLGAIMISRYQEIEPRALLDTYALSSKAEVIARLSSVRVRAYEHNATRLRRKAILWWVSLAFVAAGLTLSAVAIVHTGSHDQSRTGRVSASASTAPATEPYDELHGAVG